MMRYLAVLASALILLISMVGGSQYAEAGNAQYGKQIVTPGVEITVKTGNVKQESGCPKGSWCCQLDGANVCVPCPSTLPTGECLTNQANTCAEVGGFPTQDGNC